jgi:hypothetical protein
VVLKLFLSGPINSTSSEHDILKVLSKENDQNSPVGCVKLVWDKWAEKILDFARFSSCVPLVLTQEWYFKHLNINTMLL